MTAPKCMRQVIQAWEEAEVVQVDVEKAWERVNVARTVVREAVLMAKKKEFRAQLAWKAVDIAQEALRIENLMAANKTGDNPC